MWMVELEKMQKVLATSYIYSIYNLIACFTNNKIITMHALLVVTLN